MNRDEVRLIEAVLRAYHETRLGPAVPFILNDPVVRDRLQRIRGVIEVDQEVGDTR